MLCLIRPESFPVTEDLFNISMGKGIPDIDKSSWNEGDDTVLSARKRRGEKGGEDMDLGFNI